MVHAEPQPGHNTRVLGVLFVRRRRAHAEGRAARPRDCALALTEDEVARRYRGVDGELWLDALSIDPVPGDGLAALGHWELLHHTARQLTGTDVFDAVVVTHGEAVPGFDWLGYDVGWVSAYGTYSSLFHEALHAPIPALRAHAASLNSALLLPGRAELDAYLATRDRLLASGADVERARAVEPLAIWAQPAS